MARLGLEVGDDLRDFCNSPANQADESKTEGEIIAEIAEAVLEILLNPTHAGFSLCYTIRQRHSLSLSLIKLSFTPRKCTGGR